MAVIGDETAANSFWMAASEADELRKCELSSVFENLDIFRLVKSVCDLDQAGLGVGEVLTCISSTVSDQEDLACCIPLSDVSRSLCRLVSDILKLSVNKLNIVCTQSGIYSTIQLYLKVATLNLFRPLSDMSPTAIGTAMECK